MPDGAVQSRRLSTKRPGPIVMSTDANLTKFAYPSMTTVALSQETHKLREEPLDFLRLRARPDSAGGCFGRAHL